MAEYNSYVSASKGRLGIYIEFIKEAEDKMVSIHNQEQEHEGLKTEYGKVEDEHKELVNEYGRLKLDNEDHLKKIIELESEVKELNGKLGEIDKLKQVIETDKKMMDELNESLKKREKIIVEYDEKFEQMEEQTQHAIGENKTTQSKATTLDTHLISLQKTIDELQKQNEEILITKEKAVNDLIQEKIDNKKQLSSLEKKIEYLNKERVEIEKKLVIDKPKLKRGSRKYTTAETQTEIEENQSVTVIKTTEDVKMKERLNKKEWEIARMEKCIASLKEELDNVTNKFMEANSNSIELKQALDKAVADIKVAEVEIGKLKLENDNLKKRREIAMAEMAKLNAQLSKRGTRVEGIGKSVKQLGNNSRDIRHASEAVGFTYN